MTSIFAVLCFTAVWKLMLDAIRVQANVCSSAVILIGYGKVHNPTTPANDTQDSIMLAK